MADDYFAYEMVNGLTYIGIEKEINNKQALDDVVVVKTHSNILKNPNEFRRTLDLNEEYIESYRFVAKNKTKLGRIENLEAKEHLIIMQRYLGEDILEE